MSRLLHSQLQLALRLVPRLAEQAAQMRQRRLTVLAQESPLV
jgi:hypothetical protein